MCSTAIVFLHIPKTAGQTIHNELVKLVGGEEFVSPVRTHTRSIEGYQMPKGYRLYSGHLDWDEISYIPGKKFIFSVLRDPRERIASFYFYMLKKAQSLTDEQLRDPKNFGSKVILEKSVDDYFFGGDHRWVKFIHDHYYNFYCTYFATKKMRGYSHISNLSMDEYISRAINGVSLLDKLYHVSSLESLEFDMERIFGRKPNIVGNYINSGDNPKKSDRWASLINRIESDDTDKKLQKFHEIDDIFMSKTVL